MTGKNTMGYDCVIIPGAAKATTPFTLVNNQAFCGALGGNFINTFRAAFCVTVFCALYVTTFFNF